MNSVITKDISALSDKIIKLVFSEKKNPDSEFSKVSVKPFSSKNGVRWQLEQFRDAQVFHKNLSFEQFLSWVEETGEKTFVRLFSLRREQAFITQFFPTKQNAGKAPTLSERRKADTTEKKPISCAREKTFRRSLTSVFFQRILK